jgi:hypothetical protein
MPFRKVAYCTFLLGLGIYIWLPTAEEIIIHPALGLFFSLALGINLAFGVLLSILLYRGIGTLCLISALVLGGKPAYKLIRNRLKRTKVPVVNSSKT